MIYALTTVVGFMTLYSFYVGGRLKQAQERLGIIQAALDRHLETGEDYRAEQTTSNNFLRLHWDRIARGEGGDA